MQAADTPTQTATAAPPSHYNGQSTYWLVELLRNSASLQQLRDMRDATWTGNFWPAYIALADGIHALRWQVESNARRVRELGQLLLAWDGTKALEGGAA